MKKILYLVIGLSLGITSSVYAISNWQEVFSLNIKITDTVKVYSFTDNLNVCYVSVTTFNTVSSSISCVKSDKVISNIQIMPSPEPSPIPEKPAKVFRSI